MNEILRDWGLMIPPLTEMTKKNPQKTQQLYIKSYGFLIIILFQIKHISYSPKT